MTFNGSDKKAQQQYHEQYKLITINSPVKKHAATINMATRKLIPPARTHAHAHHPTKNKDKRSKPSGPGTRHCKTAPSFIRGLEICPPPSAPRPRPSSPSPAPVLRFSLLPFPLPFLQLFLSSTPPFFLSSFPPPPPFFFSSFLSSLASLQPSFLLLFLSPYPPFFLYLSFFLTSSLTSTPSQPPTLSPLLAHLPSSAPPPPRPTFIPTHPLHPSAPPPRSLPMQHGPSRTRLRHFTPCNVPAGFS